MAPSPISRLCHDGFTPDSRSIFVLGNPYTGGSVMRNLDESTITDAVLARQEYAANPRLKEVVDSLVRHLHAFAREVNLTESEWEEGIRFLTEVGHITDDKR